MKYLKLGAGWIDEFARRLELNYQNYQTFSSSNNLDERDVNFFRKGRLTREDIFKQICEIVEFDWEEVQKPF